MNLVLVFLSNPKKKGFVMSRNKVVYHIRESDTGNKTLCGREGTWRYRYIDISAVAGYQETHNRSVCKRCRAKAEKSGLVSQTPILNESGEVNFNVPSGDKKHDEWLSRLGVCNV